MECEENAGEDGAVGLAQGPHRATFADLQGAMAPHLEGANPHHTQAVSSSDLAVAAEVGAARGEGTTQLNEVGFAKGERQQPLSQHMEEAGRADLRTVPAASARTWVRISGRWQRKRCFALSTSAGGHARHDFKPYSLSLIHI